MFRLSNISKVICVIAVVGISKIWAYPAITECPPLTDADFKLTKVVSNTPADPAYFAMKEPIHMDFSLRSDGKVDVYYIQLAGKVFKYDAGTGKPVEIADMKTLADIGHLEAGGTVTHIGKDWEDGLTGIALDPNFATNNWIFLYYTKYNVNGIPCIFRLARWTYDPVTNKIVAGSGITIFDIRSTRGAIAHTGGDMDWDNEGNLWIGIGENDAAQKGSPCLNDLRGKILRIKPLANPDPNEFGEGKTYTIPAGNLADKFATLTADYTNPAKVKREIFVSGARNPYTVTVEPVKKWVTWGDCGPDHGWVTEEQNLATTPGFYGYPYFAGNNLLRPGFTAAAATPIVTDAACTGAKQLPPAIPGTYSYQQACAMTGPIYRFDKANPSKVKMPPHFNGKWFMTDFNLSFKRLATLNADGKIVGTPENIFATGATLFKPLEMDIGPDGAVYVLNYAGYNTTTTNTSIIKIEYTGGQTWSDACIAASNVEPVSRIKESSIYLAKAGLHNLEWNMDSKGSINIRDAQGKSLFSQSVSPKGLLEWSKALGNQKGVVYIEVQSNTERQNLIKVFY